MAGLQPGSPTPTALTVHSQSRVLEIAFSDGAGFRIPFELMRVYSPSAEVQGHGPGQEVLQTGKRDVELAGLDPVGNYVVQPRFSGCRRRASTATRRCRPAAATPAATTERPKPPANGGSRGPRRRMRLTMPRM